MLLREADPVACPPACVEVGESKIRSCAAVQAWLGFAWHFLNHVENTALFFQQARAVILGSEYLDFIPDHGYFCQKYVGVFLTKLAVV